MIDFYSGDSIPALITSTSNYLTLKFYSDGATTEAGWMAVYDTAELVQGVDNYAKVLDINFNVSPNPFVDLMKVEFELKEMSDMQLWLIDVLVKEKILLTNRKFPAGKHSIEIEHKLDNLSPGIWILVAKINYTQVLAKKLIRNNPR